MAKNKVLALIACIVFFLVFSGSVGALTNVSICGTLNTTGETYVLIKDISAGGTCFTIGADKITLDGAGYSIKGDGSGYGVYLLGRTDITIKNLNIKNLSTGIFLSSSSSNTLTSNNASLNNDTGIYLEESSDNTITNNAASNNSNNGIYLISSSDNILINNNASSNEVGIVIASSSNYNIISNNTANSNDAGIVLASTSNNTITNNTATLNNNDGILHFSSSNSTLTNNNFSNNNGGIYLDSSSGNTLTNNTINSNSNIGIFLVSSGGNTITNNNASSNNGTGIFLFSSSNYNTLTNNNASSNSYAGVYLHSSSNNTLTGNNASLNYYGIFLFSSTDNIISNNTANSNTGDDGGAGIYLLASSSDTLTGNTVNSNDYGIYLESSDDNALSGNNASSNVWYGIILASAINNTIFNNFFNNTNNFYFDGTISGYGWNTTKTPGTNIIGGPYLGGNFWANPSGSGFSETCADADYDGICDLSYTLASGNVDYLPLATQGSIGSCTTINTPGVYELTADIINSSASTCINITASDVVLDGQGYTIDGIDNFSTHGVLVNSTMALTNVTIKNLNVTDWDLGIYYQTAQNGSITSNTASSNYYGILLVYSSNNTLTDNNASLNSFGILLDSSSNYNTLTNNTANSNNYGIILISSCNYNTLTNNTASSNTNYGINLFSSNNNTITNNNASNNSQYGIYLDSSSNNTITNNTANSNTNYGIYLYYSNRTNLTRSTASLNNYGIYLYSSNGSTLTNNTASSNSNMGVYLAFSSNNTLTNNTANYNKNGFHLVGFSNNNTLTENTANNNTDDGFLVYSSNFTAITSNTIENNGLYGLLVGASAGHSFIKSNTIKNNTNTGLRITLSNDNLIYNNFFNNTVNVNEASGNTNSWNITKTSGTNIIGGPYLGGNFWNSYTGEDIDGDGLGDTLLPYSDFGRIRSERDWHPLVLPEVRENITCGDSIPLDTTLDSDYTCNGTAFTIDGNDVALDCAGHTITGDGTGSGISVGSKQNITIKNCIIQDFVSGIRFYSTSQSQLINNTAESNLYGFLLEFSSNSNNLTNNTAANNQNGLTLSSSSDSNTIKSNTIKSGTYGIKIENSNNNTIYDNFFNNTINANDSSTNFWNITKTSGTNIVNGSFLGGNFWHDYMGIDLGEDDLGDTMLPYNSSGFIQNGGDYVPLVSPAKRFYCGDSIISDSVLKNDLLNCSSTGLTIDANNITLDCRGHTISGSGPLYGIRISVKNNVIIKNCVIHNFNEGIRFDTTSQSQLINNTCYDNSDGFWLGASSQNTITNNTAYDNNNGFTLISSSQNNITSNTVGSSTNRGIYLASSSGNSIYNNLFNNTLNFYFGTVNNNDWNTTKTLGTNIIGGPYLGGNFWAYPNGTGFSETCTDVDRDGVCDLSYMLALGNVDSLPLSLNFIDSCTIISSPGVYVLTADITNSSALKCIEITSSDVTFDGQGYIIDGVDTSSTYGVYAYNSTAVLTNVTVKNLKVTDWHYGISYRNAQNGVIKNNTATSNNIYGIWLYTSSSNIVVDNFAYGGSSGGIALTSSSSYNNLSNNNASLNANYGIYLFSSGSNNIVGSTASGNNIGIYLRSSNGNIISNNTASSNNNRGIYLFSSNTNTISNNTASLNNQYGIYLYSSSSSNQVYNNLFNNTNNFYFLGTIYGNDWNTTKTLSTNIISGPYVGGNFWANPAGSGFSETCTDADYDGVCDLSYSLASGNVDYLPLALRAYFNISLIPGWNMISIPLEQDNWSIPWVLNSIEGNYTDIYAYVNGMWYWDTSLLPFFKLTDMAIDRGYWINMSTTETLELSGTVPSSTTINIVPKWNLVGYPTFATQNITTVLPSIGYTDVYTYKSGMWYWDTSLLPFFVLTEMTTGQGYWINATGTGSYDVGN